MRNITRLSLFFIIVTICCATQCRKELPVNNTFNEKVHLFPEKKNYSLGDTIWVEYTDVGNKLYDVSTRQVFSADTINISFDVQFQPIDMRLFDSTHSYCDFVSDNNIRRRGMDWIELNFGCAGNPSFKFKIGIIPKESGYFKIDIPGYGTITNSCFFASQWLASFDFSFDFRDGNKDVFQELPYEVRRQTGKGYTEERIDIKKSFILKVE